jgi:hypothetical protein
LTDPNVDDAQCLRGRKTKRCFDSIAQRRPQQGSAVIPSPLMPCFGPNTELRQLISKTQAMQDARGIRADLNPGANFA